MVKDPRNESVTARIHFKGVMLMCINKARQCEVGFIPCHMHRHRPKLTIEVLDAHEQRICSIGSVIRSDLYICAKNSTTNGVSIDQSGGVTDFKTHPDLQSKRFHGKKLQADTDCLVARVCVNAGKLYTHRLSDYSFNLVEWISTDPCSVGTVVDYYGKLPMDTGLNIICKDGAESGVAIFDIGTREKVSFLPKLSGGMRYEITISNECGLVEPNADTTDFRLYYTTGAITPVDNKRFDFKLQNLGPSPEVCERGFLSATDTLGMSVRTVEELTALSEKAFTERKGD